MSLPEILFALQWWVFIFLIGIIFLPFSSYFFSRFIDKGYIFAKTLGIAMFSYAVFLLGTLHVFSFTRFNLLLLIVCCGLLLFILFKNHFIETIKNHKRIIFFEEILFLAGIFFWAYIRSFEPSIHGLEKYMDFGFINSILRTEYFPPKDMWLTPFNINYYYFGHLATAVLTKLSGIPSNITYNLMLATIFSLCLTSTFSIGSNLFSLISERVKMLQPKLFFGGILTAILVTFSGNLHVMYAFFKPYENEQPVPIWSLPFLPFSYPNSYWYPNATRFIYNTIHEFPIYSWVVADLHGHVLDIPFVLLTLASILALCTRYFSNSKEKSSGKKIMLLSRFSVILPVDLFSLIFLSFILSVMYMTNAWDGLIYLLLSMLFILSLVLTTIEKAKTTLQWLVTLLSRVVISLIILGAGFFLFTLPFASAFDVSSIVSGVGILCAPKILTDIGKFGPILFEEGHCQHSPWWQLLMLYGFFYFFVVSFLLFTNKTKKLLASDIYILLLILLGTTLILVPEFVYVKDIYPAHYRANTMFKLVFQAFIMLSIAASYTVLRLITDFKFRESSRRLPGSLAFMIWVIISGGLITVVNLYPFLATNSYYGDLKVRKTIDGTQYLKELYPTDYNAISWINQNISNQPVILEAQGDSYTDYARVSSNTGLPTLLGWTVHEWLWRGSYDIPAPRIEEIKTLYESENIDETKNLIKKYKIELVFIGDLEREKYPNLQEHKFTELGKIIYQNGSTKIVRLHSGLI